MERTPVDRTPCASVILIPCRGRLEATHPSISSLLRRTRYPWELIVVGDGTPDVIAAYWVEARGVVPVPVVSHTEARGFAAACGAGISVARGSHVVLLSDDVIVTDGWLDQLVALVSSDATIGLAGPMSNGAPPPQGVEDVPYRDLEGMERFAHRWRERHRGQWLEVDRLSGFCVLIARRVLDVIGGLSEWGGFEEDDLYLRARQAGFRLAVAYDLFVHHSGRHTINASDPGTSTPSGRGAGTSAAGRGDTAPRGSILSRPPSRPGPALVERARVSLTMIVKDEEVNLPNCLESVRGLFDETVVVDTGSTDRTAEIAVSFGARVVDFVWVDDFAAARNAALVRATGDFVFWLDADDVVDSPQRERLRALLAELRAGDDAAYVVRCACDPGPGAEGGWTVVDHVRLFPRLEAVRWEYAVHEQILPSLRRAGVPVRWSDVTVRHTGYADPVLRSRKLQRDERILLTELADQPGEPFVLFNLGSIAVERGDWAAALSRLRGSLEASAPTDSIVRKLHALIARCHQELGDHEAALSACDVGLAQDPDDAELLFRRAVLHRNGGQPGEAEAGWRKILTLRRPERFASLDQGIYGHLTHRNLALLAMERGDVSEASEHWLAVLAECPEDREATAALRRLTSAGMSPETHP